MDTLEKETVEIHLSQAKIVLRGVNNEASKCSQVSAHKLKGLLKKKAVTHNSELFQLCRSLTLSQPLLPHNLKLRKFNQHFTN